MKTLSLLLALASVLAFTAMAADKPAKSTRLFHVVAFKFKAAATPAQIQQVVDEFRALKKKISEVKDFSWGTNVSPEKLDKGSTHGWVLAFNSEKDRDTYLKHPEHAAFVKIAMPVIEDVFVIDYWAQE